jgi:CheY-like chemotaxis protein
MELHPVEYELFSIMNDCYNMIFMRAKRKDLEFLVENDPDIPAFLHGDEVRIRQIIMNLLTNAVKYTKDGTVKLSFSYEDIDEDNIKLIVSVKDTGIGISEENKKYLFDSFKRIDEKSNRNIEGTGLGLSITKKFTEMMNGEITVDSVLYEGSTFTVYIPQRVADKGKVGNFADRLNHRNETLEKSDDNDDKEVKNDRFTAPHARILVVDDVKMNLNVVRLLLKNTGMQIDLASSGEECLKYTLVKRYDIILMDHMMPIMDGIEALHRIRQQADGLNADTPVVALTANALVGAQEMYLEEGFASYISKPVKSIDLEAALVALLPPEKIVREE